MADYVFCTHKNIASRFYQSALLLYVVKTRYVFLGHNVYCEIVTEPVLEFFKNLWGLETE
jgi:hypothetical protein